MASPGSFNGVEDYDMNLKHKNSVFFLSLLVLEVSCLNEFEITVSSGTVIGHNSQSMILPCMFPVDSLWSLSNTLISWQRGLDVVHSFYYSRDQLDRQNPLYAKRTTLFNREMARGNASLRLDKVTLKDAGVYTCSIITNSGSQKKSFRVDIAAFYSEPRLQFSLLNDGVKIRVMSEGGHPSPTLQWLIENTEDITNQTQTHLAQDKHTGLYSVSSWINLTEVTNSSLTFILSNNLLGQKIMREIQLSSDKREKQREPTQRCHGCFTVIPGILLVFVLIIMGLVFALRRNPTKQNNFYKKQHMDQTQALRESRVFSVYRLQIPSVLRRIHLLKQACRDMNRNLFIFCLSLLLFEAYGFVEFEITVPSETLIGFYGQALILPCTFQVGSSWDLRSTVITWQRGLDVVHSFYYSRDQLDRQNPLYAKRTSLFNREMARGNASLRLDGVTMKDAGVYTCSISTNSGSQKKSFGVNIAAFYSEPRLQFSVLNDEVNLLVTSEGGHPSPTLQWLIENTEDITNQTQTHLAQDKNTGLYSVSSWINLTEVTNSSLTFILSNNLLGQKIRREIQLSSDKREKQREPTQRCHGCFTVIPGILLVFALIMMGLVFALRRNPTKQNNFYKKQHMDQTQALRETV
ncbi:uncharacterized protein zgc:153911 [Triplophysa dalaica]|uniref:uncharacterized protein zgc:153911 n=1 Tax=Triplophysa dalaica TaxID=1582913 RepID=UPI0024DFBA3A|nr:uncharacterized protein zgc:153911 [Triplophysa dalaica]